MDPTFGDGHYLIVDQVSYNFKEPSRGDVIIFRYPQNPKKFFIKRIIGLPSETLEIRSEKVIIKNIEQPKGFELEESYLNLNETTYGDTTITLTSDEYFVMGDNRDQSSDSRIWGPLHKKLITGRAFLRLSPFTSIGFFPGVPN